MPHTAPARHSKSSWPASGLHPASQQQICTGCLGYASRCFWRLHCICFMPLVDAAMTCTALHEWLCSTVVIPLCSLRHVQRWLCNRLHIREKRLQSMSKLHKGQITSFGYVCHVEILCFMCSSSAKEITEQRCSRSWRLSSGAWAVDEQQQRTPNRINQQRLLAGRLPGQRFSLKYAALCAFEVSRPFMEPLTDRDRRNPGVCVCSTGHFWGRTGALIWERLPNASMAR